MLKPANPKVSVRGYCERPHRWQIFQQVKTLSIKAGEIDAINVHPQKAVLRLDHLAHDRTGETLFSGVVGA